MVVFTNFSDIFPCVSSYIQQMLSENLLINYVVIFISFYSRPLLLL